MIKYIFSVVLLCIFSLTNIAKAQVILNAGVPVSIELNENINPLLLTPNTVLRGKVIVEVMVNKKVVIATNAYSEIGIKEIQKVKKERKTFWKISLEAISTRSVDGQTIDLNSDPIDILLPTKEDANSSAVGTHLTAAVKSFKKIKT